MPRLFPFASLLSAALLACNDKNSDCAYGPSEDTGVSLEAAAGEPIEAQIVFQVDVGVYTSLSAEDAPEGLVLTLTDSSIDVSGTIAAPGSYPFGILVEAEEGNACAEWSTFAVDLTVTGR